MTCAICKEKEAKVAVIIGENRKNRFMLKVCNDCSFQRLEKASEKIFKIKK